MQNLSQVQEEKAHEALVVMAVGLRKKWKLALGYFLIHRTPAKMITEILREALKRTYECGSTALSITLDGTQHNLTGSCFVQLLPHLQKVATSLTKMLSEKKLLGLELLLLE